MDFDIQHHFDADVASVAAVMLDADFQRSLDGIGPLESRTVLEQAEREDGSVSRTVRYVLGIDLGPARRLIGDQEPAWREEAVWRPEQLTWEWEVHPEVAAELLAAAGKTGLESVDGSTRRRVHGHVRVHVPFYGGRVERAIVRGMKESYEDEARRLARWLQGER